MFVRKFSFAKESWILKCMTLWNLGNNIWWIVFLVQTVDFLVQTAYSHYHILSNESGKKWTKWMHYMNYWKSKNDESWIYKHYLITHLSQCIPTKLCTLLLIVTGCFFGICKKCVCESLSEIIYQRFLFLSIRSLFGLCNQPFHENK